MSNFNKVGPDLNEKGDGENQPEMAGESENTFIGPMDSIRQTVPEDIGKIKVYPSHARCAENCGSAVTHR